MDPTACLREMLEAWADGDFETASDRLDDLREWLQKKGFPPHVKRLDLGLQCGDHAWIVG